MHDGNVTWVSSRQSLIAIVPKRSRRECLWRLAAMLIAGGLHSRTNSEKVHADEGYRESSGETEPIVSPEEALTIFDFEAVAKSKLHMGHAAFLAGSGDEGTYRANRDAFASYKLRARRLIDTSVVDTSLQLFGAKIPSPIVLCPCGALKSMHEDGELAVARATKNTGHVQVLANGASYAIEDVVAAKGGPVWFQLYRDRDWNKTLAMIRRAESAGSEILVWTVDGQGGGSRNVLTRTFRRNRDFCASCHQLNAQGTGFVSPKPMQETPPLGLPMLEGEIATWDFVKRLKDTTRMKIVIKGIVTKEDAEIAVSLGADGVWISNHGGRTENSLRATVDCIKEVVDAVEHQVPIIVDGGFRSGEDIFKALALGVDAVGIGRPYLFGLASFGQEGVAAVLTLLDQQLRTVMKQMGTISLERITETYLVHGRHHS